MPTSKQYLRVGNHLYALRYLVTMKRLSGNGKRGHDGVWRAYVANFLPSAFSDDKFATVWLSKEQGDAVFAALTEADMLIAVPDLQAGQQSLVEATGSGNEDLPW